MEAVIRPERLREVKAALKAVGCSGIMTTEIEGHGQQGGIQQQWMGEKYEVDLLPKTSIDVIVNDKEVDEVINAIITSAKGGVDIGDGKIFVYDVSRVIRIRTGEEDEEAL